MPQSPNKFCRHSFNMRLIPRENECIGLIQKSVQISTPEDTLMIGNVHDTGEIGSCSSLLNVYWLTSVSPFSPFIHSRCCPAFCEFFREHLVNKWVCFFSAVQRWHGYLGLFSRFTESKASPFWSVSLVRTQEKVGNNLFSVLRHVLKARYSALRLINASSMHLWSAEQASIQFVELFETYISPSQTFPQDLVFKSVETYTGNVKQSVIYILLEPLWKFLYRDMYGIKYQGYG